jgi:hypothetical protein
LTPGLVSSSTPWRPGVAGQRRQGRDAVLQRLDGERRKADPPRRLQRSRRGLADDRCQLPRWGYVITGKVAFRFADREETYEAGDAYYVPPGHTPVHHAGAEIVEFSPTDVLGETIGVVMENLRVAGVAI